MALSDYVPAKRTVQHDGKTLVEVRGLNLEDSMILMRNHLPELCEAWDLWESQDRKLLPENQSQITGLIITLMIMFPDTAARMISMAADEGEDGVQHAKKLPLPLQVKIIAEIVEQTFEDVGGPLVFAAMMRLKFSPAKPPSPTEPILS